MRQDFRSILCSKFNIGNSSLGGGRDFGFCLSFIVLNGRMRNGWYGQYRVDEKTDARTVVLSVQLPPEQETGRIHRVF